MLKHMLRRDPKADELVGVALSLAGSDPKDLVRNISDKISESIKIKPSELNQTEADLGMYLIRKVRRQFFTLSRRHREGAKQRLLKKKLEKAQRVGRNKKGRTRSRRNRLKSALRWKLH